MPDAKFLEEYQLYRKFKCNRPEYVNRLPKININMHCSICKDTRTFILINRYYMKNNFIIDIDKSNIVYPIEIYSYLILSYICASCRKFSRFFNLRVIGKSGTKSMEIEKVGQYPPWNINIERNLKEILKNYSENYKKGKTCESQSYGIGAFAYYRRIVEDVIGELLESIQDLMIGEELEKYQEALEEVRKTKNTADKIALVKDLLPPILKPEQFNPLKTIHDVLSKGLHGKTDEECLDDAELIRTSLVFLVNAILSRRKGQQEYTESMKKIIEKQRKKIERN